MKLSANLGGLGVVNHLVGLGLIATLSLVGCSKEGKNGGKAAASGVLQAWKKAGLEPSAFEDAAGVKLAGKCQKGTVSGIDTLLCTYPDEAAAKQDEDPGLVLVGEATGAAVAKGPLLLVVADRKNADPSGKTINRITKAFRGDAVEETAEQAKPAE